MDLSETKYSRELFKLNSEPNYKFEHFFELSPDLMCIAGFDGYFKWVNPAVSNLLGYTNEELLSKPIDTFIYSEDRIITSHFRERLKENNPLLNFENRYVTKGGDIVWLHWTSMPALNEQLVYAVAKDITHRKKVEELRNQHLTQLTHSHDEMKQLTYTAAHDLRSPVNNLLSLLNLIDTSSIDDKDTLDLLFMAQSLIENLKLTLNSSLDVLIEKNNFHIVTEELRFSESLNHVLRSIQSLIKGAGACIETNFSEAETICFNKSYLESIFLNLITNAIKYARPGHAPHISISTKKENGITQLIVSDNGLGFDTEKIKDKIFGFRQKFHDHSDSKGIGLYLVNNHLAALGGKIAVESQPNQGAKFIISFKD
jgi:PAS domain S-box-containing protein